MKIILGDNPFFSVNHRTGGSGGPTDASALQNASAVIFEATKNSIETLMISDYEVAPELLSYFGAEHPESSIRIALVVPYPHTINNLISRHGYLGAIKDLLGNNFFGILFGLAKAPILGYSGFFATIFENYITLQLQKYQVQNVTIKYICLHNVVVDLLLANQRADILEAFLKAVKNLGRDPVLITQNIVRLVNAVGDKSYTVCGSYNLHEFMTNPNRREVLQAIDENCKETKYWAMQILASGAISPNEALQDKSLKKFDAILYATSNPHRVEEFSNLVKENE